LPAPRPIAPSPDRGVFEQHRAAAERAAGTPRRCAARRKQAQLQPIVGAQIEHARQRRRMDAAVRGERSAQVFEARRQRADELGALLALQRQRADDAEAFEQRCRRLVDQRGEDALGQHQAAAPAGQRRAAGDVDRVVEAALAAVGPVEAQLDRRAAIARHAFGNEPRRAAAEPHRAPRRDAAARRQRGFDLVRPGRQRRVGDALEQRQRHGG
jgi:hypothetical protein